MPRPEPNPQKLIIERPHDNINVTMSFSRKTFCHVDIGDCRADLRSPKCLRGGPDFGKPKRVLPLDFGKPRHMCQPAMRTAARTLAACSARAAARTLPVYMPALPHGLWEVTVRAANPLCKAKALLPADFGDCHPDFGSPQCLCCRPDLGGSVQKGLYCFKAQVGSNTVSAPAPGPERASHTQHGPELLHEKPIYKDTMFEIGIETRL